MKFLPVLLAAILLITSCGGGSSSSSSTTVAISVSPTAVTLTPGQSAQFTATVTNNTNTAVTWQVNGTVGGNTSVGLISTAGAYTAPAIITVQSSVTVTAVSQADTTKTATATVTLNPTNVAPSAPVLISPSSAALTSGAQQTFSASVSGAAANVVWSVSCPASVAADCGSITQSGVYTAPFFPPPGGSASITATSSDSTGLPGNAPVTISVSNQSLFGSYAFALSGNSGPSVTAAAGSITFDGQGNVSGGIEDIAGNGGSPLSITGGTYHIGTDARGNVTFQTSAGTFKWQIVMVNHSRVSITSFDSGNNVSTGTMNVQIPAQFNAGSIQGGYSFIYRGASSANPAGSLRSVGAFTADGSGAISQGLLDRNDSGTALTALATTGSFTAPSANGRGTLSLTTSAGTQTYVYYMTDGSLLKLLETDASAVGTADAVKQSAGPFTAAGLRGILVTAFVGSTLSGNPLSTGGILTLDGTAGLKATIDTNNNGNTSMGQSVTGTYAVTDATTGRTTLSYTASDGAHQLVAYPTTNGDMNLLEIDSTSASGPALAQKFVGFSNASFSGKFATRAFGVDFSGNPGPTAFTGQLLFNGGSALSGVLDINDNGTLAAGSATIGSYVFDSTGRATANVTSASPGFATAQLAFYAVDGSRALFINTDSNRVVTGIVNKQF